MSVCHTWGEMFDVVRVDHFRAFDTYWKIPADCPTAIEGEWIEAPGYELFDTLFKQYPNLTIIAEDLGDLRPEVLELRDHYQFRGMRIVQFTFDPEGMEEDKSIFWYILGLMTTIRHIHGIANNLLL